MWMPMALKTAVNARHEIMKAAILHSRLRGSFEHIPTENNEYGKKSPRPFALKANPKIPPIIEIPIGIEKLFIFNDNVSWREITARLPKEPKMRRSINLEGIGSENPESFPQK